MIMEVLIKLPGQDFPHIKPLLAHSGVVWSHNGIVGLDFVLVIVKFTERVSLLAFLNFFYPSVVIEHLRAHEILINFLLDLLFLNFCRLPSGFRVIMFD